MKATLVTIALLAACAHAPPTPAPTADLGRAIGDSTAFGARVIRADPARGTIEYRLTAPAHVVAVVVEPGQSIEPVVADARLAQEPSPLTLAGTYTMPVLVGRRAAPPAIRGVAANDVPVDARVEYQRCVDRVTQAMTPRRPPARQTTRDTTGKTPAGRTDVPLNDAPVDERRAESQCAPLLDRKNPVAASAPAADGRERYVLLLASDTPLSAIDLVERINALTVKAEDVPSTMVAIAEGVFADRAGRWSGHFVRYTGR